MELSKREKDLKRELMFGFIFLLPILIPVSIALCIQALTLYLIEIIIEKIKGEHDDIN